MADLYHVITILQRAHYAKYLIVGKISDLKIELLCNGKVLKDSWFHTTIDLNWITKKIADIIVALDMAIRSTIWKPRRPVQRENFRRKWDAH